MKYYISILMLLIFAINMSAQEGGKSEKRKNKHEKRESKIAAKKVGYFTEQLDFSTEEAQRFWPVYNEFQQKIKTLKSECKASREAYVEFDEENAETYLNNVFDKEQKILDLVRSFYKDLETVLPKAKIAKLYVIERKFMDKIYSSLKRKMNSKSKE